MSVGTAQLWKVKYEENVPFSTLGNIVDTIYVSLNDESTSLSPDVADALGLVVYTYLAKGRKAEHRGKVRILAAECLGVVIH